MGCFQSSEKIRNKYDYDLIVIGGGAAGLSCALTSSVKFKQKVLLCNYECNYPKDKKWLGGTSTNVGTVSKGIIIQACEYIEKLVEAPKFGWKLPQDIIHTHDWAAMVENIQNYIRKRNFELRKCLNKSGVDWINAYASFVDPHTISLDYRNAAMPNLVVTAKKIVLAVGLRPDSDLGIPGCQQDDMLCTTTEELFNRTKSPGKTLIIGGDYLAVECASLLLRLGFDVTMYLKQPILGGLDFEYVQRVNNLLVHEYGLKVLWEYSGEIKSVKSVGSGDDGQLSVSFWNDHTRISTEEIYDTVLVATGRKLDIEQMQLTIAGVNLSKEENKIEVDWWDRTSVHHIYAIGDCASSRPENAAMAKKSGMRLSYRLFKFTKKDDMKFWTERGTFYDVPFILQTPIEYGTWGFSEQDADQRFGEDRILVYEAHMEPLEWALTRKIRPYRNEDFDDAWGKIVCQRTTVGHKIIGFHYMGPLAKEITTTMAMASQFNIKKETFDDADLLYPTIGRLFFGMEDAKADQFVYTKTDTVPW